MVPRVTAPRATTRQGKLLHSLGKELALQLEALGEMLLHSGELPERFARVAEALAGGRSIVPLDGEVSDWPARLKATRLLRVTPRDPRPGDGARSLRGWLGASLAAWLGALLDEAEATGWVLRGAVDRCVAARDALLAAIAPVADAHATWYSAGSDAKAVPWVSVASRLALEEAVDRWVALSFDADLPRYVSVWQKASARWVELVVGTAVEVSIGDLGALRSLRVLLEEFATRGVPAGRIARMAAERLDVTEAEVRRLLTLQEAVKARIDPREVLRRRAAVVRPIAKAVAELSDRGRAPTVSAVARRAKVHPALVELCLEALDLR